MSAALLRSHRATYTHQPIYRLTVEQYHELVEADVLTSDDPVELLEGLLVTKMSKDPPHVLSTRMSRSELASMLPEGWSYISQDPVTLLDGEPEPNGAVVRGGLQDYFARHPSALDTAMVIKVADSSLSRDRGIKLRSYARAGIPIYWIINLIDHCVEVYTHPAATGDQATYHERLVRGEGERVEVVVAGEGCGSIEVASLLPPPTPRGAPDAIAP